MSCSDQSEDQLAHAAGHSQLNSKASLSVKHSQRRTETFADLIETIRKDLTDSDPQTVIQVARETMELFEPSREEWEKFAFFDGTTYTRNLVFANHQFALILLCWAPGQASSIHDHAGSHCWARVLDGELTESLHHSTHDGSLTEDSRTRCELGSVCYINDHIGVHRVRNITAEPAVSLHLYSPPFDACRAFNQQSGRPHTVRITYHSTYGLPQRPRASA